MSSSMISRIALAIALAAMLTTAAVYTAGCDGTAASAAADSEQWDISNAPPIPEDDIPEGWINRRDGIDQTYRAMMSREAPLLETEYWAGAPVNMDEYKGKVVVIAFWGTWCPHCRNAVPKNKELVNKYADHGLVFVGVHSQRDMHDAQGYMDQQQFNYPSVIDALGRNASRWQVRSWPTYGLIDRWGRLRALGLRQEYIEHVAVKLLNEKPS